VHLALRHFLFVEDYAKVSEVELKHLTKKNTPMTVAAFCEMKLSRNSQSLAKVTYELIALVSDIPILE
jgi:hypothetical protein